jgi:hypothetical protein
MAMHTEWAMKAVGLADLFATDLGKERIGGGQLQYRPEIAAPDGPSTAGGKQSVQHLRLVPFGRGTVIVAGWANQFEQKAELRTWRYLAVTHAQRFKGERIPLDQANYEAFAKKAHEFFTKMGLVVTVLDAPADALSTVGRSKVSAGTVALVAAISVVVAATVSYLLLR